MTVNWKLPIGTFPKSGKCLWGTSRFGKASATSLCCEAARTLVQRAFSPSPVTWKTSRDGAWWVDLICFAMMVSCSLSGGRPLRTVGKPHRPRRRTRGHTSFSGDRVRRKTHYPVTGRTTFLASAVTIKLKLAGHRSEIETVDVTLFSFRGLQRTYGWPKPRPFPEKMTVKCLWRVGAWPQPTPFRPLGANSVCAKADIPIASQCGPATNAS